MLVPEKSEEPFEGVSMPEINTDKVCFVIVKSRESVAADSGMPGDSSNASDDGFLSILTERGSMASGHELAAFIDAMDEDEQAALVALMWIGRGDYAPADWKVAMADARARRTGSVTTYLLGTPLLSDYLETALAEYGETCTAFEMGRL
jgi:hypothetical protein